MNKILTLFAILLIPIQVQAYQSPYQNMWWDAVWNKDCIFDTKLQMCKSESENYKTLSEYNKHRTTGHYVCIGGKLHKRMGFNQQPILLTQTTGYPVGCSLDELNTISIDRKHSYKDIERIKKSQYSHVKVRRKL